MRTTRLARFNDSQSHCHNLDFISPMTLFHHCADNEMGIPRYLRSPCFLAGEQENMRDGLKKMRANNPIEDLNFSIIYLSLEAKVKSIDFNLVQLFIANKFSIKE
jgi:hypothetical protein